MLLIIIGLFFQQVSAQNHQPENGPLFLQDELARVDILLPADTVILMYDSIYYAAEHEFEATFVYSTSSTIDTIPQVGFRFRGNTSIEAEKKNFKISFNTFTSGGQFHGVEKLNLNGEHNDVSLSRSKLSWELLRAMGLSGSRTSYVQVYINDIYAGLYLNVEHIDEEFVKKRYGQKVGNLYKCLWPATLEYWGSDPENYKATAGDRRIYDLKTNRYRDDYSGLANFISVLNNASDSEFRCEIEERFNVDDYLKIAAFDVLIGNWDGYIFNKNNYYLYENPASGRIEYIPYDLDNTWGIDWLGPDWTQRPIYDWNNQSRPLYDRLMGIPKYRQQFSYYLNQMMNDYFDEQVVSQRLTEIRGLISSAVEVDDFYTFDYGFTYDDFLESDSSAWGEHVEYGILPYIAGRRETALEEIENFTPLHVIKELRDSLMDFDNHLISAWIEGETDNVLLYVEEGDVITSMPMYDDGEHMDGEAGDGEFALTLTAADWGSYADFFVENTQGSSIEVEPCGTRRTWFSQADGPLYINELMPANDFVISDEAGEFDDWLELFNPGSSAAYLGEYYLTDDIHCPLKWQMPNVNMAPASFQLIWADNDEEQGPFHANFKLTSQGEELAIFKIQNGSPRLIDHVDFPAMAADHSWGRAIDAQDPWVVFSLSTPNASNSDGVLTLTEETISPLHIFPNPSRGLITVKGVSVKRIELYDGRGMQVRLRIEMDRDIVDLTGLSSGIYQMIIEDLEGGIHNARLIINP